MVCINCGHKTQITNSRPQKRDNQVWRRRQCLACKSIFTTLELADYSAAWLVQQPAGGLEAFCRDKLFMSLYNSLRHRPDAVADAGALTATVINKLLRSHPGAAIGAKSIARIAQVALNRFDRPASVHYTAIHKL